MAAKITVRNSQNLLDIAIQFAGDVSAVFAVAQDNGIGITDALEGGSANVENAAIVNADIAGYYADNLIHPATGTPESVVDQAPGGIGYWAIGVDFIVS